MAAKIVILGGGVGGTVAANRLAGRRDVEVLLVDNHGVHLRQPGLLRMALDGGTVADHEMAESKLIRPGVNLRIGRAKGIDPDARRVRLEDGTIDYDWLVLATGSRVQDRGIPGFRDHANHFHCGTAAEELHRELSAFKGGRIVVGVSSLPYKCPPVMVEFALLLEERLRGRAEIVYTYPVDGVLMRPDVANMMRPWLEEKKIRIETSFVPSAVEPKVLHAKDGRREEFDLLVLVPPHAAAPYLRNSALAGPSGFVPADKSTMKVRDRIYAIGDTADLPVPKTAAAAMGEGEIVAANIASEIDGASPAAAYDGRVSCHVATGGGAAAHINFSYASPPAPLERTRGYFEERNASFDSYFAHFTRE